MTQQLIPQELDQHLDPQLRRFIAEYYRESAAEELYERSPEDLLAAAMSHWRFARQRHPGESLIRIYEPELIVHGWSSRHSLIEIVCDDAPYLLDSLHLTLKQLGLTVYAEVGCLLRLRRENDGSVSGSAKAGTGIAERFIQLTIDRQQSEHARSALRDEINRMLTLVVSVHQDQAALWDLLRHASTVLAEAGDDNDETLAFLDWLNDDHFLLLGGASFARSGQTAQQSLGVVRFLPELIALPARTGPVDAITLTQSGCRAPIGRPGYPQLINLSAADGRFWQFVGFYSTAASAAAPRDIPLIRRKVQQILGRCASSGLAIAPRRLADILATYPRDELFEADIASLADTVRGIALLSVRERLRLFLRVEPYRRYVTALIFVARDRYDAGMVNKMQEILRRACHGREVEFDLTLADTLHARLLFRIWLPAGSHGDIDVPALEIALTGATRRWQDELRTNLLISEDEPQAILLYQRYADVFPVDYRQTVTARLAADDIALLEQLRAGQEPFALSWHNLGSDGISPYRFTLLRNGEPFALSFSLPMLSRFGITVLTERAYCLQNDGLSDNDEPACWLSDFGVRLETPPPTSEGRDRLRQAIAATLAGDNPDDEFNRLVLAADLPWPEVHLLRALAVYARCAGLGFSLHYQAEALLRHPLLAQKLSRLFQLRLHNRNGHNDLTATLLGDIQARMEHIASLDDSRILRALLSLALATLRCNGVAAQHKPQQAIAFKFAPSQLGFLDASQHWAEYFVYSPRVEGVFLKAAPLCRGDLQETARQEGYREEALTALHEQSERGMLIAPRAAAGRFICKGDTRPTEGFGELVNALLDLTDNRLDGQSLPASSQLKDKIDDYLSIHCASDMASTANRIALARHYWLGEAFAVASGQGYLHPAGQLEAQAVWLALQRHFHPLAADIAHSPLRVIVIGKPSDPRVSGLLRQTPHWHLVAACDDRHILLDPAAQPLASHAERLRLITTPDAGWGDFQLSDASHGGGVWSRHSSSIPLSRPLQAMIDVNAASLSSELLIQALLRAPVDCLIFADAGIWIKAELEHSNLLTDRRHDSVRVDAATLRSQVIVEYLPGALTTAARVEYALKGGHIFSAAIDNAAAADLAEREAAIRLLLEQSRDPTLPTLAARDALLAASRPEALALALSNHSEQLRYLSAAEQLGAQLLSLQGRFIDHLEQRGLNRQRYGLPTASQIDQRRLHGQGLTAPEQASLIVLGKNDLYQALLASPIPDELEFSLVLTEYFPASLCRRYPDELAEHPLRREIVAGELSNRIVNRMGPSFLFRVGEEVNASPAAVVRAWHAACEIFNAAQYWHDVRALDFTLPASTESLMHHSFHKLLERATRWLLRNYPNLRDGRELTRKFAPAMVGLSPAMLNLLQGADYMDCELTEHKLLKDGVPHSLARMIARCDALVASLDIIEVAHVRQIEPTVVAEIYLGLGRRLQLDWLLAAVGKLPRDNRWQTLARATLRDELYRHYRALTALVLQTWRPPQSANQCLEDWLLHRQAAVHACQQSFAQLINHRHPDLAMLSAASRELRHYLLG